MNALQQVLLCLSFLSICILPSRAQSSTIAPSTSAAGPSPSEATLPSCATYCAQAAIGTQSCAPGNQTCLCLVSTQIQESIYKCLVTSTTTSTCSEAEKASAFEYYPLFCKSLNLAVETKIPLIMSTAGGAVSTRSTTSNSSLILPTSAITTTTVMPDTSNNGDEPSLQLPAILGITLMVVFVIVGVAVLLMWSFLQRRQLMKRPRMDLEGEFVKPKARPPRSRSINSDFKVQPPPIEKDIFGGDLSRSSTLVPPPPVAKDVKRSSEDRRTSARNKTLKTLLSNEGLRASLLSSTTKSESSSLVVPPLDIRKSEEDRIRVSKF